MIRIEKTLSTAHDGSVEELPSGEKIFKLHSHPKNPIIKPQDFGQIWYDDGILKIGSIFNCGSALFDNKVILTPRVHSEYQRGKFFDETIGIEKFFFRSYISKIWILSSEDGINFERYNDGVIKGDGTEHKDFMYGIEDVRIIKNDDLFWLIGCGKVIPPFVGNKTNPGDRIAIYSTQNFRNFKYHGIVPVIESRNALIFPEAVSGKQYILLRFAGNIYINYLKEGLKQIQNPSNYHDLWTELYHDRKNKLLLETGVYSHENEKIGSGPPPIKTEKGWLIIYHGVGEINAELCENYNVLGNLKRAYSVCAAILDLNNPSIVLCRTKLPIYIPSYPWELFGEYEFPIDVPAVVFPMGMIVKQNKILLYCGAGDKYIILLTSKLDSLLDYLWKDCKLL